MKVGNGNSFRVWLDPWLPEGAILEQVGERVMYDAASRRKARLSDFIDPDGEWLWPRVSLELIDLWERVQEVSPCLSVSDSWVWVPGRRGGFSIASAWEAVRPRGGRVLWDGLLWGGGNIQKHFFCAWLAIKDRLGFFGSWVPLIGLGIGGLSCLGFVIKARDPIVLFHLICSWIRARAGSWRKDAHLPF
ncbi:zf-RVT domain-containing protein [Cucumis melo var. makuwa]|uniref:Zf-RVT domain-containing protein n=1 Tax=Cucumis melo var. makuwa TaxID=1194695 RepID=A0A5D3DT54_CUCMM|nr:zf-RVT domain-containing protein [Cucumis melo var. makuwa]